MTPVASWRFRGISRFDAVISGGLAKAEVTVSAFDWNSPAFLACIGIDETYNAPHPIAGGSDAGVPDGRGPFKAPHVKEPRTFRRTCS